MTTDELKKLEATLWQTADTLRANSDLKSSEYSTPVLGLIFLRFADNKYSAHEAAINAEFEKLKGKRNERPIHEIALEKCGFYLPKEARYEYLLNLPEKEDIAKALKKAMQQIEKYKPELKDTLPVEEYFRLVRKPEYKIIPKQLLKNFADIPRNATGDMFGQIYEYFLGKFALADGQGGGEFFTPRSVVRVMVEIIEPHQGTVFDPACGSGGMFVQSSAFVEARKADSKQKARDTSLYVYGQEKTLETVKLAKMNLAVNGLRGEIKQANTYYEDPHGSFGKFDYVLANPPFNVDDVNLAKVESDRRFNTYGMPRNKTKLKSKERGTETVPNGNYLWINLFATSLKPKGRAALVMANSASDARNSEADIRKTLIEKNLIYAMLTLPSNMFYTVTLPATLWFFDKGKQDDKILFIDARNIFTQIDRAHREFTEEQIQNIAVISRLHRGDREAFTDLVQHYFTEGFSRLAEHRPKLAEVAGRVSAFLKANKLKNPPDIAKSLAGAEGLEKSYQAYRKETDVSDVVAANKKQRKLHGIIQPFFAALHEGIKELDKQVRQVEKDSGGSRNIKLLKTELEALHKEARQTEYFFGHIGWLQERFPDAKYEDVTGLCKLASRKDVEEQEYSLNPGRYVGVVIEEDGKTEEEFIEEMLGMNEELSRLNAEARELEDVIGNNIRMIAGNF
jgi:type I restriction enzyme M protein